MFSKEELRKLHKPNLLKLAEYLNVSVNINWSKEKMIDEILKDRNVVTMSSDPNSYINPENMSVRVQRAYNLLKEG